MSSNYALILKVLLGMAPFSREPVPESSMDRISRLTMVAHAIADAPITREERAALLTLGEFESHFARYIGIGQCLTGPYKCDVYRGVPRARTYWQVWRSTCPAAWAAVEGSEDELGAAARCAAAKWSLALARCHTGVLGAFAGYAGDLCSWAPATARAARYQAILAKL